MNPWGNLKSFCHIYLPVGLTMVFVKSFGIMKYGFEGSVSNIDLGSTN